MSASTLSPHPEPVRAPEFPDGLRWLNSDRPLRLRDLRGRVVLLDFWTHGCINCQHVLPDLAYLERTYRDRALTVIGVHSPKFANERDPESVRHAILRHAIAHPVVLDEAMAVWQAYGVRAWPTMVLIDPRGYLLGSVSGEGHRAELAAVIAQVLDQSGRGDAPAPAPALLRLERPGDAGSALRYPGKVLADAVGGRLFVADSGHNRLVVADLGGAVRDIAGAGEAGSDDGSFDAATFRGPQGMALVGETLYVADTGNHLIRALHLRERTVRTVAGTGEPARPTARGGPADLVPLNAPWDLRADGEWLSIAMAGLHQIRRLHLRERRVDLFAGSGAEGRVDGPAWHAAFAQPSGLAGDGATLWVADSEISCVRAVSLADGTVATTAGGDLFAFGDRDGAGDAVRLQHPLGIAHADGVLYLADTYNHRIKRIDPRTGSTTSLYGDGTPGVASGERPRLREPGGLSVAAGRLYIADTDNQRICVAALPSGPVLPLPLAGLCAPGICVPTAVEQGH